MSSLCTVALVGIAACEVGMLVTRGSLGRGMGGCWLPRWPHRLLSYGSQGGVPEGCGSGTPPMSFALAQEGFLWGCELTNFRNKAGNIQDGLVQVRVWGECPSSQSVTQVTSRAVGICQSQLVQLLPMGASKKSPQGRLDKPYPR